jgi:hypothetical protein
MTQFRAILNAAILFVGVCLMLGVPGAMMIDSGKVLAIYSIAVLGFATWLSWDTYRGSWAEPGNSRTRKP